MCFCKKQPHIVTERLASHFSLSDQLLTLILNFLSERVQQGFVNGELSKMPISNTSSPQGCVLSPHLFTCTPTAAGLYRRTGISLNFLMTLSSYLHFKAQNHIISPAIPEFVKSAMTIILASVFPKQEKWSLTSDTILSIMSVLYMVKMFMLWYRICFEFL